MFKSSFQDRIIRAAKLDSNLYEEVEADKGALWQAMTVVVFSSIAAGIGIGLKTGGFSGIITGTMASLISWYLCLSHLFYRHKIPSRATDTSRPW